MLAASPSRSKRAQDSFREIKKISLRDNRGSAPARTSRPPPSAPQGRPRESAGGHASGERRASFPKRRDASGNSTSGTRRPKPRSGQSGSDKPRRRQRGAAAGDRDAGEDEKDEDLEPTNYEIMLEDHGDLFASTDELKGYAQVVDLIDGYRELQAETDSAVEKAKRGDGAMSEEEAEARRGELDDVIHEAMDHILEVDERYLPRYLPQESWTSAARPGTLGEVPTGPLGMGARLEDNLRYVAQQVGHESRNPKHLAEKLISGEFVKFTHAPEKYQVLKAAEQMAWEPGQSYGTENVGFEEPSDDAKRSLVTRVVSGQYSNPKDSALKGKFAQNVARILNGNATYPSASKDMLLRTIAQLMPEEVAKPSKTQATK